MPVDNPALVAMETEAIILRDPLLASPVGIYVPFSYLALVRMTRLLFQQLSLAL